MADCHIGIQIKAVAREIAMRERAYPKWVKGGRMKPDDAEREIAAMKAVIETLKAVAETMAAELWRKENPSMPALACDAETKDRYRARVMSGEVA